MKPLAFRFLAACAFAGGLFSTPAHAASKQYVIVISEGMSPQVVDLGKAYLRVADQDPEEITAFHDLDAKGPLAKVEPTSLNDLKGLLQTAETNGFRTGFVTTGDLTADAALFYNFQGDVAAALAAPTATYDFIAGGGRSKLPNDIGAKIKAAGGTYIPDEDSVENEISGRVLAPQADEDLDYALDRDPRQQAGLTELAVLAIDSMGAGDYPFVLIVHDTLAKKALETKDTPALVEQFRELNSIVSDSLARHEDNPNYKAAFLFTGGVVAPRLTIADEAEQKTSLNYLANMMVSFHAVNYRIEQVTEDALKTFANPVDGLYRDWKISDDSRAKLLAGTLEPEAAARAFFEPLLKINYDVAAPAPIGRVVGFNPAIDLTMSLKVAVAEKVEAPAPPPADEEPMEEPPVEEPVEGGEG